jgi:hypothetical protein
MKYEDANGNMRSKWSTIKFVNKSVDRLQDWDIKGTEKALGILKRPEVLVEQPQQKFQRKV